MSRRISWWLILAGVLVVLGLLLAAASGESGKAGRVFPKQSLRADVVGPSS